MVQSFTSAGTVASGKHSYLRNGALNPWIENQIQEPRKENKDEDWHMKDDCRKYAYTTEGKVVFMRLDLGSQLVTPQLWDERPNLTTIQRKFVCNRMVRIHVMRRREGNGREERREGRREKRRERREKRKRRKRIGKEMKERRKGKWNKEKGKGNKEKGSEEKGSKEKNIEKKRGGSL